MKLSNKAKTVFVCIVAALAVAVTVFALNTDFTHTGTPDLPGIQNTSSSATFTTMISTRATDIFAAPSGNGETTVIGGTAGPIPTLPTVPATQAGPTSEDILKKVTDGVNALKSANACYVGTKTQNIVINVTDCSYPFFLDIINGVVGLMANEEVLVYDFTNGYCTDPEENITVSSLDVIPPEKVPFSLTISGVASTSVERIGDNIKYSVTLVPETGTYQQPKPTHHGVACDTLDFSRFDIPMGGKITKSDFNYPGATVSVTYNSQGQVVGYSEYIAMNGVGEGEAIGITASAAMEGYIDESWVIEWK